MSIATTTLPPTVRSEKPAPAPPSDQAPAADRLFAIPQTFDFFQAVRLLERLQPQRQRIGEHYAPQDEIATFRVPLGTAFPPSSIADLQPAAADDQPPAMTVAFLGLTGPSGVLPAHYSELLLRLARDERTPEKHALRAWFDLFNHRLVSLFYRAWEKYRPWVAYDRGEYQQTAPDVFTSALLSFSGLASMPRRDEPGVPLAFRLPHALVRYAGLLAHRPHNAANLQAILADYFALPVAIQQFCGQWLPLETDQQTQLGRHGALGVDTLLGSSIWDRQSKVRIQIGPLSREQFERLLPDAVGDTSGPTLAEFFAVIGFYLGATIDFDVQLTLSGTDIPACQLCGSEPTPARLGWNSWLPTSASDADRSDATFTPQAL